MENIFWDVEFDGTAKKDGRLTVSITFGTDIVPPGTRSVAVFVQVRAGMSPEAKAQATVNALKAALGADFFEFEFSPPDDDFKLRIKTPGPNERYIREMWVRDSGTGEDIEADQDVRQDGHGNNPGDHARIQPPLQKIRLRSARNGGRAGDCDRECALPSRDQGRHDRYGSRYRARTSPGQQLNSSDSGTQANQAPVITAVEHTSH
jgi:hypothetical protein